MDKYAASWEIGVKKRARHILRDRKLNTVNELPDPEDISKLATDMQEKLEKMEEPTTYEEFRKLQYLTMALLIGKQCYEQKCRKHSSISISIDLRLRRHRLGHIGAKVI